MSLISILLFAAAVLAVTTGFVALVGASRADRGRLAWFFVATVGTAVWALSIAGFLGLAEDADPEVAIWMIFGIYLAALVMAPALLGYSAWKYTIGKVATVLYILFAIGLGVALVRNPSILVNEMIIGRGGNTVVIAQGWFYFAYIAYFCTCLPAFLVILLYRALHTKNKRIRTGDYVLLAGMAISCGFTLTFDLILPFFGKYSSIWVGPFVTTLVIVTFFYAIIKYRVVSVSAKWMRALAYVVVMAMSVIAYMLIFYTIFTVLFKIPNPSTSVLVLNFLMIVIVLLLMPVINELIASIRSTISVGQVDIAYVVKKLNHLAAKNVDLRDLASFLADHLHFAYIGFIINGRLYGSKSLAVSPAELSGITHLRPSSREVWQVPNKTVQKTFDELGLKAVAELRNAKGKTFGQLIVGKPLGKASFERRDLVQLEMIINLVATVIDSEKHLRA